MSPELFAELAVVALCLAGGGILKGATGAGAPVLAVPALAAFFDVRFAIVVMLVPNLVTNSWQILHHRGHILERRFMIPFVGGGVFGAALGTLALKAFASDALSLLVAFAVFGYVALRLARPHWRLQMEAGRRLALPAGIVSGILQGAAGVSAPVSITFLNALRIPRETFIASISTLFVSFTMIQIIVASANGLILPGEIFYSLFALAPVWLAMPLGARLAKRISAEALDRVILALLCAIALKLVVDAVW